MYRLTISIAILLLLASSACNPWASSSEETDPGIEIKDPATTEEPLDNTGNTDETVPPSNLTGNPESPAQNPPAAVTPPQTRPKPNQPRPNPEVTPPSPPRPEPPAPANEPAPSTPPRPQPSAVSDPTPRVKTMTVEAGTPIEIRLAEAVSSKDSRSGQRFEAILDSDLEAEGTVLASKGSRVVGRLSDVRPGGKVKGKAQMTLNLTALEVNGEMIEIETNDLVVQAESDKKKDAKLIGITTGIGAAIGAIVGGGKGAAIGAAIGGGAGTARVLTTRGDEASLKNEQLLGFRTEKPVAIPIKG